MDVDFKSDPLGNHSSMIIPHFKDMRKPTVSETYQYLNKLISGKSVEKFENLNELVSSNFSLPLFEENLRLFIIDSLHLENEVLNILLSQNDFQIQRILRCRWFFQNLSKEFCTKKLFPYISVSLRCKIINRLSKNLKNTNEAERYFIFIRNNYSNERAEYLLPKCSPKFILNYFEEVNPTFEQNTGPRILLNICKSYPEVGIQIISSVFDTKKDCKPIEKYEKIFLYLAGHHLELMVPFIKKYYQYIPSDVFGRKLTKKLGPKVKEYLLPKSTKIFKEKHLFSLLTLEEKVKLMTTVMVSDFKDIVSCKWGSNNRACTLLKLVPAEDRPKIVDSALKEVCNLCFNSQANWWYAEILELLPNKSRQFYMNKLAVVKAETSDMDNNKDNTSANIQYPEEIIYLLDSSTAFEKFKEILRQTPSVQKRENIFHFMLKNCCINNDIKVLQEVIEYVAKRHRNDDPYILDDFLNRIFGMFPWTSLNSATLENMQDLAYFLNLKKNWKHSFILICDRLKELCIYNRLENNMDVTLDVKNFFKSVVLRKDFLCKFVEQLKSKHSKTLILGLCQEALQWLQDKTTKKSHPRPEIVLQNLLHTCEYFNNLNLNNQIFLNDIPGLREILLEKLKENFDNLGIEDWPSDIWEKDYHSVMDSSYGIKFLFYVLKKSPSIIEKHLEGTLNVLFSQESKFYNIFFNSLMMAASFFEKTEKVKEIILNEFKNGNSINKRKVALKLYSRVCTIEEFNNTIGNYIPKQEKVKNRQTSPDNDFDEIQILIPRLIKNVRPRWKNLQLTLKFFFGDFLKSVLPSFWACCYYTRYDVVIPFLKEQLDAVRPNISYKKDIIKLLIELSDREGKYNFYLKFWDEYKHYSIRSILLSYISKSFLEQPSRDLFQILEKCILECDNLTIKFKPDLQKIPKDFCNDYLSALWRFSETQENPFKNVFRASILSFWNRDSINLLSPEFCDSIIKDNLFNSSSELRVDEFAVIYLVASSEKVESRVRMVLNLLEDRKPDSQTIYRFVTVLIAKSHEEPVYFAETFRILIENWPQNPSGILFEEHVLLTYYYLYQKVLKRSLDSNTVPAEFGKELKKLYSSIDSLNDLLIVYVEALKKFFNHFKTFNAILTVRELIENSRDRTVAVLAILSVPREAIVWHKQDVNVFDENIIESKKVLNNIVEILEGYNDRIVEVYLRWKFDFLKQ